MEDNQPTKSTTATLSMALEELAAYINDSKLGYDKAAANAVNPDHQTVYRQLTEQRTGFLNELNGLIRGHGGQTEKSRVIEDDLYRQWIDTQANPIGGDDETLVLASLKGEEWTLKAYDQVLGSQELPASERQLFVSQKEAIQAAQTQLGGMRLSS
jgi:uncharacterized protein (TIGR02284 family)